MPNLPPTSRHIDTRTVIDQDGIEIFATWVPPKESVTDERLFVVSQAEIDRPDLISWKMYGTPAHWWYILRYNKIQDPFSMQVGDKLIVPTTPPIPHGRVSGMDHQELDLSKDLALDSVAPKPVPVAARTIIPPFDRVPDFAGTNLILTGTDDTIVSVEPTLINFGFPAPRGLTGTGHFQIQVSTSEAFSEILLSRFTVMTPLQWHFFDPFVNSGGGGHMPFPSAGIDLELYAGQTVYFKFRASDGLTSGVRYFLRYRVWVNSIEGQWQSPPPLIIQS